MIFPFSLVTRHSFLTPRNALCMACSCFTHQPPADTCDHIQKQQKRHHNHSIRRNAGGLHRLLPAQSWSQDPSFPTRSWHTPLRDAFCIRNSPFLCSLNSTLSAGPSALQGDPHVALTMSTAFLEQLHLFSHLSRVRSNATRFMKPCSRCTGEILSPHFPWYILLWVSDK